MKTINNETLKNFEEYLTQEEKSPATIEKYIRDVTAFVLWLNGAEVDKRVVTLTR